MNRRGFTPEAVLAYAGLLALLLVALGVLREASTRRSEGRTRHARDCERRFASDLTAADSLRTVVRHECVPGGVP